MKTLSVWLLFLLATITLTGCETVNYLDAAEPPDAAMADLVISSTDFMAQMTEGMSVSENGLSQESIVTRGIFVMQTVEAPLPLNDVVPQRIQDLPETNTMGLK